MTHDKRPGTRLGTLLALVLTFALVTPVLAQNDERCKGTKIWCRHLSRCTYPDDCRPPTRPRKKGYHCEFRSERRLCGWELKPGPHCAVEYVDGNLRVRNVQTDGACFETYHPEKSHEDVTITARITTPEHDTGGLIIGEFWEIPEPQRHFYTFQLYPTGEFALWRFQGGSWQSLGRQRSEHVRTSGWNELKLELVGGNLSAWINGQWVASIAVTRPPKSVVGIYVNAPGVKIDVDWIKIERYRGE